MFFELPPEAANPEQNIPERLLNPPAIVQTIDLSETTFGTQLRIEADEEAPQEHEAVEVAEVDQAAVPAPEDAQALVPQREAEQEAEVQEQPAPLVPEQARPLPMETGKDDPFYDGAVLGKGNKAFGADTDLSEVRGILPFNPQQRVNGQRIIYINGISTSLDMAFSNMRSVANTSGREVVGIYNATDGNLPDVMQAIGDKWTLGNNPAVKTLSLEMRSALENKEERHFVGDSHGALIMSRALAELSETLRDEGWTEKKIQEGFARFKIETFGGAAWSYPDGPQYVHYINTYDPVPFHFGLTAYGLTEAERSALEASLIEPDWMKHLTGVMNYLGVNYFTGREPGKEAKIIRFEHPSENGWLGTHMTGVYLHYRKPFDTAYASPKEAAAPFEYGPYAKIALRFALTGLGLVLAGKMLKRAWRRAFKKKEETSGVEQAATDVAGKGTDGQKVPEVAAWEPSH